MEEKSVIYDENKSILNYINSMLMSLIENLTMNNFFDNQLFNSSLIAIQQFFFVHEQRILTTNNRYAASSYHYHNIKKIINIKLAITKIYDKYLSRDPKNRYKILHFPSSFSKRKKEEEEKKKTLIKTKINETTSRHATTTAIK